jgi:iron complex outermembrane receptor protein
VSPACNLASLGLTKNNWTAEAYGTNLSDSHAGVFTSSAQFIKSEVPLRPRLLGLKIGYSCLRIAAPG